MSTYLEINGTPIATITVNNLLSDYTGTGYYAGLKNELTGYVGTTTNITYEVTGDLTNNYKINDDGEICYYFNSIDTTTKTNNFYLVFNEDKTTDYLVFKHTVTKTTYIYMTWWLHSDSAGKTENIYIATTNGIFPSNIMFVPLTIVKYSDKPIYFYCKGGFNSVEVGPDPKMPSTIGDHLVITYNYEVGQDFSSPLSTNYYGCTIYNVSQYWDHTTNTVKTILLDKTYYVVSSDKESRGLITFKSLRSIGDTTDAIYSRTEEV